MKTTRLTFNAHPELRGKHAFLGASKYHWLRYSKEQLVAVYNANEAKKKGTELHDFASHCIRLKQKLPNTNRTLNMFVNDAIDLGMRTEQPLYFSENCFGTADAISFRKDTLMIFDYKSGQTPAHMEQLQIYAAMFCLEYGVNPIGITIILRIYQFDDFVEFVPEPEIILEIMDIIKESDKLLNEIKYGG